MPTDNKSVSSLKKQAIRLEHIDDTLVSESSTRVLSSRMGKKLKDEKQDALILNVGSAQYPTLDDALDFVRNNTLLAYLILLPTGTHTWTINKDAQKSLRGVLDILSVDSDPVNTVINFVCDDVDSKYIDTFIYGMLTITKVGLTYTKPSAVAGEQFLRFRIYGDTAIRWCEQPTTSYPIFFGVSNGNLYFLVSNLLNSVAWAWSGCIELAWSTILTNVNPTDAVIEAWSGAKLIFYASTIGSQDGYEASMGIKAGRSDGIFVTSSTVKNVATGVSIANGAVLRTGTDITFTNVGTNYGVPTNIVNPDGSLIIDSREGTFRSLTQADADTLDSLVSYFVSTEITKFVGAGQDFETLQEALDWVDTLVFKSGGAVKLKLKPGVHKIGYQVAKNDYYAYNYTLFNLSQGNLTISGEGADETQYIIALEESQDIINGWYDFLTVSNGAFLYLEYLTIDFFNGWVSTPATGYLPITMIKQSANLHFREVILNDSVVKVSDQGRTFATQSIFDGSEFYYERADGVFTLSTIRNQYDGPAAINYYGSMHVNLISCTLTGNSSDYSIPANEIQNDGSYITDGTTPLKQKLLVNEKTGSGNFTPDLNLNSFFKYTLTGNAIFDKIVNCKVGQSGMFIIQQDATGGWTADFEQTSYEFGTTENPLIGTAPNTINIFKYSVIEAGANPSVYFEFISSYVK